MNEKTIALPFSIDPYGKVTTATEQSKIWADRVRSVVGTTLYERVMRPDFGGKIAFKVFESQEAADAAIKTEVANMFNTQLPLLKLGKVETYFNEYTGTVNTDITYSLPNDQVLSTSIGLVYINSKNPPIQEKL